MPKIKMPDGTVVDFPDDMPKERIRGLIASKFPEAGQPSLQDKIYGKQGDRGLGKTIQRYGDFASRKVVEGALSPIGFAGDLLNAGINKVAGTNLGSASEAISSGLTKLGLPEAETAGERVVGDVISTASGAGGLMKGGRALAKKAPKVSSFLTTDPKAQLAAAAAGSLGSGVAREAGASPFVQTVVGLGAGLRGASLARTKQAAVTAEQLRSQASKLYSQAEKQGGVLKKEFSEKFIDELQKFKPQSKIAKQFIGDSDFTKAIKRLEGVKGKKITLNDANELDKAFTQEISKPAYTNAIGKLTEEGKKLFDIQSKFRTMVAGADESLVEGGKKGFETLKNARSVWARSRKLADIEAIIERAALTDNPATSIKSGFRTLASNPRRLKGYTPDEIKAIKKAASSGVVTDALRTAGSRLIPIITASSGGGLGATAASMAASNISRGGATAFQTQRAQNVADLIASGGLKQSRPLPASGLAAIIMNGE